MTDTEREFRDLLARMTEAQMIELVDRLFNAGMVPRVPVPVRKGGDA